MPDDRTYIRLHDGFDENHKIVGLSDKEFRTYVETLCYCSRNLTDGFVPFGTSKKLATPRVWRALVASGLVDERPDGYSVHDYLEHQRSAEQVKQLKEARREAGKRGGKARATNQANAKQVLEQKPKQDASRSNPDTEAETKREELLLDAHASKESETIFDEFWGKYPRKVAKRKAETAWKSAIKRADASVILAGLARFKFSEDQQYIPHPSAWLNADRWADQVGPQLSIVGGQQTWSASELDAILGPDMWRCPQPPQAEITAGTAWEWQQQVKAKHRADRIAQAASKLGISA